MINCEIFMILILLLQPKPPNIGHHFDFHDKRADNFRPALGIYLGNALHSHKSDRFSSVYSAYIR